jgi:hypothetical protein
MTRIYFDTNIFSNLESNTGEVFQQLNQALKLYKQNLSLIFSPAHIRDKRKADERKIEYFKFIEELVGDNHISYHAVNKNTSMYLATPTMVYNDDDPASELPCDLLNSDVWNPIKDIYKNIPLPFDTNKFDEFPEENRAMFARMFPLSKENPTMYDLMERQLHFVQEMKEDSKLYKELRTYIFDNFNKGEYTTQDKEIDFNEAFKDGHFQKTFVEHVKSSIYTKHEGRILFYDYFLHAYSSLDMLGISKDDLKANNGYNNINNQNYL